MVTDLLSTARLVTLTGAGGVGKTRLAIRAAEQVRRAFADGVWQVELAPLAEPALLAQTVADTLGVGGETTRSATDVLAEYLAAKRLLLVLDNCEHVLDACASLVHRLLSRSENLCVLVTSRQQLSVPGEHLIDVPPLPMPAANRSPDDLAEADRYDSIRLFAERAAEVRPNFEITADNYPAVAGICTMLEGIPLAIEMAVQQLRVLSANEILDRLGDRCTLLTANSRIPPARHQTLTAAIDWSFDLCTPAEQLLWTRLSVFSGGFDLAAAEEVGAGRDIARENVVDLVTGLVQKSLLTKQDHDERAWYHMLDSIRHYGRTRLSSPDDAVLRRRHRDLYQLMTAQAEKEWFGPHQRDWCVRLGREHANLRIALDFCLDEPGDHQIGLAMITSLWRYWLITGSVNEAHRWLSLALGVAAEPTPLRAKALWITGWIAQLGGDYPTARAALDECRSLADEFGYRSATAHAMYCSGRLAMSTGDYTSALALYQDALTRHRAQGDEVAANTVLCQLAMCYCLRGDAEHGDLDHAIALGEECRKRCAAAGETWCRARSTFVHSLALWKLGGRTQRAEQAVRESIRLQQAINDIRGIGMGLELLAWIIAAGGRHAEAAHLSGATRRIWHKIDAPMSGIRQLLEYRDDSERQLTAALGAAEFEAAAQAGAKLTTDQVMSYGLGAADSPASAAVLVPSTFDGHRDVEDVGFPLTRRERQVAELVAKGLSNKEIATSLGIAQRTAESHVQHILTKLGVTSRTRLATWVLEHRRRS